MCQLLLKCGYLQQRINPLGGNRAVSDHRSGLEAERGNNYFVFAGANDHFVITHWKVCEGELTKFVCRCQANLVHVTQELDAERMGGNLRHREYLASNDEFIVRQSRMDRQGNLRCLGGIDQLLLRTLICALRGAEAGSDRLEATIKR